MLSAVCSSSVSKVPASSTVRVVGRVLLELVDMDVVDEEDGVDITEDELEEDDTDDDVVVVETVVVERKVRNAAAAIKIMITITTATILLVDTTKDGVEPLLISLFRSFRFKDSEKISYQKVIYLHE